MRRPLPLAASLLLAGACAHVPPPGAAPTAADVQTVETSRIYEPITDYTRDGRAYVEFAPRVETRAAACTLVGAHEYVCTYESRVRDAFARDYGRWEPRRERLVWRNGCWTRLPQPPPG